ncbi:dihydrofolate reductase [Halalkalibacter akibai]|uniref:Dihydrofolate reductase n=1 Tax=Halalkalibacter akibai (strain ATCC 43226 / DSM 21942 / CIP 109018 / JCM 9157 / 1139) TaxID=1236973 RepID=W4QPH9_HALA3|nr:dihydrofolate reductase [Halalkalibacter akibai]GAE33254.1 dihydrofolate reductase [Halalkalibacter akibai JCM 9157]
MISFVVAMDRNQVIGKDNQLPWHLPADLKFFKKVTTGHTIVMGRKTYESIGRPLPNRHNVILTTNANYEAEGCEVVHQVEDVLQMVNQDEEFFIIGGTQVFSLFWDYVDRLYVTFIDHEFEGDTFFPKIEQDQWDMVSAELGMVDEKNVYPHEFRIYEKKEQ